jgi:hypothetical protein
MKNGPAELINIEGKCRVCGQTHRILDIPKEAFKQWQDGNGHIQDVLSTVSKEDREFLISHTCPKCWDKLFKNLDE